MTKTASKLATGALLLAAAAGFYVMAGGQNSGEAVVDSALSGGETTVHDTSRDAFALPASNLPVDKLRDFTFGNKMFNTNWVEAPASVKTLDGLGPTFNRVSCSGCHFKDGRGRPPLSQTEPMNSMLLRLSIPGVGAHGGPNPHAAYGDQLNNKANPGIPAEGAVSIAYEEIHGSYADGAAYTLLKPTYKIHDLAFGPLGNSAMVSPRVAPAVFGLGLLEAIPEAQLEAWADPEDRNKDGISGRINHVWSEVEQRMMPGRLGWKANAPTIRDQDSAAAVGDIGITTSVHPQQNCPAAQTKCRAAIEGGKPEMSDMQLDKLVFYSQVLAPPARRDMDKPEVKKGAALFSQSGCAACHKPSATTGPHVVPELANQQIQPFTDLLLHDMGEGLADGRPDFEATGSEWRTAPLWGIGLVDTVNQHTRLLHDGRARNVEEAILWHGGEAEKARENFRKMNTEDRAALVEFVNSL